MAEHTLIVRRMVILPGGVQLYGADSDREIVGPASLQYQVTIDDVITYEPIGTDLGWYVAVAPAMRPAQP